MAVATLRQAVMRTCRDVGNRSQLLAKLRSVENEAITAALYEPPPPKKALAP